MSQANRNNGNNPTFSFSSFEDHGSVIPDWFQQFSQDPRAVGDSNPSPTASVQTSWTVPLPRQTAPASLNIQRPKSTRRQNKHGMHSQNLALLGSSDSQSLSTFPGQADPLTRFYNDPQPWNPHNMRESSPNTGRVPYTHTNGSLGPYRDGSRLDIGSIGPGSDSGYQTQPAHSVSYTEPGHVDRDLSAEMLRVAELKVRSTSSEATPIVRGHSDQASSHASNRSGQSSSKGQQLRCSLCGDVSKCKSELKKHSLKHEKPFTCKEPNCKRNGEGFTTVNDLDRHRKSVHGIGLKTKSYRCASDNCRNKEKIWPRLDNFKQHIDRMHKDEDELELIKRSVFNVADRAPVVESSTVAPMDTSLAVAGMEKTFSDNPAMRSMANMDLPVDQGSGRWPSLSTDTNELTRDRFHMPSHFNLSDSSIVNTGARPQGSQEPSYTYRRASGATAQRESRPLPSNVVTETPLVNPVSEIRQQKVRPSLSNAPQTKVEQQRSALKKLSRVVTNEIKSSTDSVDLEELVLRILHRATDSARFDGSPLHQHRGSQQQNNSTPVLLTKGEAMKATQMISNLIKNSPGSSNTVSRRPTQGFISNAKECKICGYTVARDCDLRKHMKRHEKPYGCTYPKCHKRFGAKSDWKRHENSQHFQLEAFRCAQDNSIGVPCGQHFWRADLFKTHLDTQHKVSSKEEREAIEKRNRIGKNCQVQFWCGFCAKIIKLVEKRNAAWDERFDHIAQHFEKDKRSVDDWVCVEENKSKKELLKEMDRYVFDDDEEKEDVDAQGEVDDEPLPPIDLSEHISVQMTSGPLLPQTTPQTNPRKRQASTDAAQSSRLSKQRRLTTNKMHQYCCSCSSGPFVPQVYAACIDCSHHFCSGCRLTKETVNGLVIE